MHCSKCGYNNPLTEKFCKNCEVGLEQGSPSPARHVYPQAMNYAGFWVRLLAAFLDILVLGAWLILLIVIIAALVAFSGRDDILHDPTSATLFYGGIVFMVLAYYILLESSTGGATFGKRWMNIKVMDKMGNQLSVTRAAARFIARLLSFSALNIGFLSQPFTRRKQALHDMFASTVVVSANDSRKISIMATLLVLFMALMVPVLAILSTAGLPVFQQQILKVQLNNGVQTGRQATLAVARFYHDNGRVPSAIGDTGRKISLSPHVAGIEINQKNGEITVLFSEATRNAIRRKNLIFTPTLQADSSISWKCHSADIEARYLPGICQ